MASVEISNPGMWAFKIMGFFMSVALMVSSFFLKSAWDKIGKIEQSVHDLEITLTERTASRFDSSDWVREKILLDAKLTSLDRRLIKLEESLPAIKESLDEIKDKLDK
jgi:hypothetical protein